MPIYVGVNGEAKLVTEAYIGNRNNQAVPLYLGNIIPKTHIPVSYIYLTNSLSHYDLDTNIIPSVYTKTITVFAPYNHNNGGSAIRLLYSGGDNYRAGFYREDPNNLYIYCGDFHIPGNTYQYNGPTLQFLPNLNSIPTNYYTLIMNKSTNKETVLKVNNDEVYRIGTNPSGTINNAETIKLIGSEFAPICYFAVYKNSITNITPLKEYFPCIERDSGVPGFYETTQGIFYFNNKGRYAAGPAINEYSLPSFD